MLRPRTAACFRAKVQGTAEGDRMCARSFFEQMAIEACRY